MKAFYDEALVEPVGQAADVPMDANGGDQALELCRAAGIVSLGHVALDGTTVRANRWHRSLPANPALPGSPTGQAQKQRPVVDPAVRTYYRRPTVPDELQPRAAGGHWQ